MKYKPPDLTDSSLLTVEIRNSGVRHVVAIIDESQPGQDLDGKQFYDLQKGFDRHLGNIESV